MVTVRETLEKKIADMEAAGIDSGTEQAELAAMGAAPAPAVATKPAPAAKAAAPAEEVDEDELFIPLNIESFKTGGGGWITPESTGWKDAICVGTTVPSHVTDQLWFIFENVPDAEELFRGALVTAALMKGPGEGGAWKVKEVLDALMVEYDEDEESGGIRMKSSPKGKSAQVFYDDVVIKGKTERRIQDVQSNVEAVV